MGPIVFLSLTACGIALGVSFQYSIRAREREALEAAEERKQHEQEIQHQRIAGELSGLPAEAYQADLDWLDDIAEAVGVVTARRHATKKTTEAPVVEKVDTPRYLTNEIEKLDQRIAESEEHLAALKSWGAREPREGREKAKQLLDLMKVEYVVDQALVDKLRHKTYEEIQVDGLPIPEDSAGQPYRYASGFSKSTGAPWAGFFPSKEAKAVHNHRPVFIQPSNWQWDVCQRARQEGRHPEDWAWENMARRAGAWQVTTGDRTVTYDVAQQQQQFQLSHRRTS